MVNDAVSVQVHKNSKLRGNQAILCPQHCPFYKLWHIGHSQKASYEGITGPERCVKAPLRGLMDALHGGGAAEHLVTKLSHA
jgi:hypothetical protein